MIGFYAATRLAAELLVGCYSSFFAVTTLRFFFIYGRGQKLDMPIPRLVDNVRDGRTVKLEGSTGLKLNPIHADDAAGDRRLARPWRIADDQRRGPRAGVDLRDLRDGGRDAGCEPVFEMDEDAAAPPVLADISLMKERLGAPARSLREGLGDFA